jgi:hypothetical protein
MSFAWRLNEWRLTPIVSPEADCQDRPTKLPKRNCHPLGFAVAATRLK